MTPTVALVIAEKGFRDEEYQVPKELLEEAGYRVLTVSTTLGTAQGKLGMAAQPDLLLPDLAQQELAALVFIGGGGSSQYFNDPTAHQLAQHFYEQGKIVGAICIAPVILANAGLLNGKRATVFPDGAGQLQKGGAHYTASRVEVDGRIITASDAEVAGEFGKELLRLLGEQPLQSEVN